MIDYKKNTIDAIKNKKHLFGDNFGFFYPAGNNIITKVFPGGLEIHAIDEFEKLKKIKKINDSRIKTPTPYELILLGNSHDFKSLGNGHKYNNKEANLPVYGVVMELFQGKTWWETSTSKRKEYSHSLKSLIEGFIDNGIYPGDFQFTEEVICLHNSIDVGVVDMHNATFNENKSFLEKKYNHIMEEIEELRQKSLNF